MARNKGYTADIRSYTIVGVGKEVYARLALLVLGLKLLQVSKASCWEEKMGVSGEE